jgi:hypothetical protein
MRILKKLYMNDLEVLGKVGKRIAVKEKQACSIQIGVQMLAENICGNYTVLDDIIICYYHSLGS